MPHDPSRRSFVHLTLAAAAFALTTKSRAADDSTSISVSRAAAGFRVGAGQDRYAEDLRIMGMMEHFFHEMGKLGPAIPKNQEANLKKLWADHGMEIVGPPLPV